MAITALDIKDKQFTTKFRGYNEQEVDEMILMNFLILL